VVILDDYHKVSDVGAANELMLGLLELTPPGVHFVLSTRSVPPLPLARLRLSGELLEITQSHLALDFNEVSCFFLSSRGPSATDEECRLVLARTGGWVAGVSLLCQSLKSRDKGEVMAFLRGFAGDTDVVYDYFAEEVLRQQTAHIQRFLMCSSLLSELHGDLLNSMLEIGNAQSILESLAANNVFIYALDERREWYKYHPLFREFLRVKAKNSFGQQVLARLHRKAASAYETRGDWGRVIDHLCACSSFKKAAGIIQRVGGESLDRGHLDTVKHWLVSVPDQIKDQRPWLLLMEGQVAQQQGNYREANAVLARAQSLFAEESNVKGLTSVAAERSQVMYRMGKYSDGVELLEQTRRLNVHDETQALLLGTLCISYRMLGDLHRAAELGEQALHIVSGDGPSGPRPGLESRTLRVVAQTCRLRGELDRGLSFVLRAVELGKKEQLGGLELGWVLCTLGVIRATRGEMDLALRAFDEAEQQDSPMVPPQRQRLCMWRGNVLTDIGEYIEAEVLYQMAGFPDAEMAWLNVRQRQYTRAVTIAREALDRVADRELLARASLLTVLGIALGLVGQGQRALDTLQEAAVLLASHGYTHHLASCHLHMARLMIEAGAHQDGLRLLLQTMAVAESLGFYHFYWWDPALLAPLLRLVSRDSAFQPFLHKLVNGHPGKNDYRHLAALLGRSAGDENDAALAQPDSHDSPDLDAHELLASCRDSAACARISDAIDSGGLSSECLIRLRREYALTWREIEVFVVYYLDRDASDSEAVVPLRRKMAVMLHMTENTLKSHVKSIRRKLGLSATADSLQVYRLVVA